MFADNKDPSELGFWKDRFADRTIIAALRAYPESARRIFGALPTMSQNLFDLVLILGARELLAEEGGRKGFHGTELDELLADDGLREAFEALGPVERRICGEILEPGAHREMALEFARKVIRNATGTEPTQGRLKPGLIHEPQNI